jgi:hypothetical protein
MSDIRIPGATQVTTEMKLNMVIRQLQMLIEEMNLMSIRLAVTQNLLKSKTGVTDADVKAEWDRVIGEARAEAARAKLVTPDGKAVPVPAPEKPEIPPAEGHA